VEFRILGPLEVVRDGELIVLGAAQQRALLAVLVLHGGDRVSIDRLIHELWGERVPATAAKTVQGYVSHLRRALGAGVIVTHGRDYRLAIAPEQVDAFRFEALRAEGRRALGDGNPARAKERLCSALALWRGEPLADFAYEPFAQAAIGRLQDARLAALEDRIEADLALGSDAELVQEIESLIASNPLQERLRGQLMLALYRAGRQADALTAYRHTSELLREELGLEPSRRLQELERSILEQDTSLDGVRTTRRVALGVCPFKGLACFDRADAEYFFGRERVVLDLLARLVESPLVGILGPSGIGKSSLLRAGVLPALSEGSLPGSGGWRQVLLRPGTHPNAELNRALAGDRLGQALARLSPGERLVVAVDQLEELFTLCEQEGEQAGFLEQLVAAARDPERRALVVVALRADFYGRLASHPRFAGLVSRSHVLVGPMDRAELARAIEQPAARAGLELETGLVDALVSDVAGEPGGLPLLSTALLELWRAREGRTLRYASYQTGGGVRGAVARLAEDAYSQLGQTEQRIARGLMLRLAGGEDGALTRRRVPLGELERITGAVPVLAELTDARLLTVSDGDVELSHEALLREWPRYRAWLEEDRIGRRLRAHLMRSARDWDARGRDVAELYRGARLASALDWAAQHDVELNALEREFIGSSRLQAEHETRRQRSQNRRLRGLLLGVGLLLAIAVFAGIVALVNQQNASHEARAATLAARAALGRQLGAEAVNQPRIDLALLLAREAVNLDRSPQTEATLLDTLLRTPAVIRTFVLPINAPPQRLALAPDGLTLAVGDNTAPSSNIGCGSFCSLRQFKLGEVRFFNLRAHTAEQPPLTDFSGGLPPVYSSDGTLLIYPHQGDQTFIAVRDAHTLAMRAELRFDPSLLARAQLDLVNAGVLIAPDRHTVYCAYSILDPNGDPAAAYLDRWSLPGGRRLSTTRIGSGGLLAARLVGDGTRVILVRARGVSEFDTRSLLRVRSVAIAPTGSAPSAAAVSPDGRTIVIGAQNGRVSFIDLSTGAARIGAGRHNSSVSNVVYAPDGRTVTTTGGDDKLIVWDPGTARPAEVLSGPAAQPGGAATSADGQTLYTVSLDGVVLEWDLTGDRRFGRRVKLGAGLRCCGPVSPQAPPLALSPDGSRFAARVGASTVGVFSTITLRRQASFTVGPKRAVITALTWSPTGRELAVAGYSGLMQLWSVTGAPRLVRSFIGLQPLLGRPEAIQSVAFSPDNRLLAASDDAETQAGPGNFNLFDNRLGRLTIWQRRSGKVIVPEHDLETGNPGGSDVLAFSHDGKLLAVSLLYGPDLVLDPSTAQTRQTLRPLGAHDTVSLAFAPNGTLATGTQGGLVQLWNPLSGDQIAGPVAVSASPVTSIAFDPTGQQFATTAGEDGAVKLWFTPTLQQQGLTLATEPGARSTVAFEPRGTSLLVVDDRGTAFTWPTSPTVWEQRACTIAGRNLTRTEWTRFSIGRKYTRVCP
jgi:DNA-binding SARP family transcriptional activator/WD40 repeat protein